MCLAIPGKIVSTTGDDPMLRTGTVDFGGIKKEINLSFVPGAKPGDYVLVHVGFALNTIDEDEAARVFEYLEKMDDLKELDGEGTA
jgi:hydrogenase expression/formation protein HypC